MQTIQKTWSGGTVGKLFIGCAGLIILSCLCAIPTAIFGGLVADSDATPASRLAEFSTDTATPAVATNIPLPTPTPEPSAAPVPAAPRTDGAARVLQAAHVLHIVDGDTIEVEIDGTSYRVRYIGMDTPEQGMPYYDEATQANAALVAGQDVWLEKDVSETDQYNRLLRYVYVGDTMVNAELVRQGYAQIATYPPDVKHQDQFQALQQEAQAAGLGLWAGQAVATPEPTQPGAASLVIVEVNDREEYVDIQNMGGEPVDLAGWLLRSERGSQDCGLGDVIQPGEVLRVWAMAEDADKGGYNCGFDSDIWNNSEPDPAILYDPDGVEVSRRD
jgi:endonuclease YncB( thermonuclease family)